MEKILKKVRYNGENGLFGVLTGDTKDLIKGRVYLVISEEDHGFYTLYKIKYRAGNSVLWRTEWFNSVLFEDVPTPTQKSYVASGMDIPEVGKSTLVP